MIAQAGGVDRYRAPDSAVSLITTPAADYPLHSIHISIRQQPGAEEQLKSTTWPHNGRLDREEWLDLGYGSESDVEHNLQEMERTSRYLGGYRALTRHLFPRLAATARPLRLVDIGTGGAGLPRLIARWARCHNMEVRVLAFDRAARHLTVAAANARHYSEIVLVRGDGEHLPLPSRAADYAISSLVLHHFAPESLLSLLRTSYEVSCCGLVMTDLVRGWLPYFAFRLAQPVFASNFLTRHDGALSIRRAYKPQELLELARAAGLPGARVYTHWPWRMTLVVDR